MSDSQRFSVAAHTLVYLAHQGADALERAVSSALLAASMPTNPVVVRRVNAMLTRAGLIETRAGGQGGAWLRRPAEKITLDQVLEAVNGCAPLGPPLPGAKGWLVGESIPLALRSALKAAEAAVAQRLSQITIADVLAETEIIMSAAAVQNGAALAPTSNRSREAQS